MGNNSHGDGIKQKNVYKTLRQMGMSKLSECFRRETITGLNIDTPSWSETQWLELAVALGTISLRP